MDQLQRVGHWLGNFLQFLLKNLVPFVTVLIAFIGFKVNIFGLKTEQIIVLVLAFLALNALVERFFSFAKIEREILSFTHTHMPRMENAIASVELTSVALELGVIGMTSHWTDFIEFNKPFGEILKKYLHQVEEPATWYIVTTNPEGFFPWRSLLENAVENRGIDIKWAYHSWQSVDTDPTLKAQALMLFSKVPTWDDRMKGVKSQWERTIEELKRWVEHLELRMKSQHKTLSGSWELYQSSVPHFFMAFLSVPKKHQNIRLQDPAPNGTFGFVQLYPMFAFSHEDRPAIFFKAPGSITDTYYRSIISMFDEDINQGYVQCIP